MSKPISIFFVITLTFVNLSSLTVAEANENANGLEQRRQHLMNMLGDPGLFPVRHDHFTRKLQSRKWQYFHTSLAQGRRVEESNRYFATRKVQNDEWLTLMMLNTYCEFKETLAAEARERMREIVLVHTEGLKSRDLDAVTKSNNENHLINWKTIYLLADQEFGGGDPVLLKKARDSVREWVRYRVKRGMEEFNSPHYAAASLHALLLLYDYYEDPAIKQWTRIGIDAMLANYALLSLNNVRGGPYYRTIFTDEFSDVAPLDENRNGLDDRLYEVGYLFFGNCPPPVYRKNDGHFLAACITTTSYRLPQVIFDLATDKKARKRYSVRLRRRDRFAQDYNLYYYITESYSLGSMQNRVELDNFHSGRAKAKIDHWNNQVWELTFAHPRKILGPKRNLSNMSMERKNPNTSNMHYKNVLFYKGHAVDYNGNLGEGGGAFSTESIDDKKLSFWRVVTDDGEVYVATTHYEDRRAGILEVGLKSDHDSFKKFKTAIRTTDSRCDDTGLVTHYTSTLGDVIFYNDGKGTVTGMPFALKGYPTYESPFANAVWDEAVMEFSISERSLRLDARDLEQPIRTESGSETTTTRGLPFVEKNSDKKTNCRW